MGSSRALIVEKKAWKKSPVPTGHTLLRTLISTATVPNLAWVIVGQRSGTPIALPETAQTFGGRIAPRGTRWSDAHDELACERMPSSRFGWIRPPHRFTPVLTHQGEPHRFCECSTALEPWEGQAGARDYRFGTHEVGEALVAVARGASRCGREAREETPSPAPARFDPAATG